MLIINRRIRIQTSLKNSELVEQKLKELTRFTPRCQPYSTNIGDQTYTCVFFDDVLIREEDLKILIDYLGSLDGVFSITY